MTVKDEQQRKQLGPSVNTAETDIDKIAGEGNYLNQDLLDAGLARLWQG